VSDAIFVVSLSSTMLILDTIRKKYFSEYFTELPPSHRREQLLKNNKKGEKEDVLVV